jgi:hypothetical protein
MPEQDDAKEQPASHQSLTSEQVNALADIVRMLRQLRRERLVDEEGKNTDSSVSEPEP